MRFVAIDFETANHSDPSICAAGMAVFEDGHHKETFYSLVRPPKGYGWFREDFIAVHGITHMDVRQAPEFPVVAAQLLDRIAQADLVVAHNAPFDLRKLQGTLSHYGIQYPSFRSLCTLAMSRRAWPDLSSHSLDTIMRHLGMEFEHHHAGEDAEAAGRVFQFIKKLSCNAKV